MSVAKKERDAGTGAFLGILQNILEHLHTTASDCKTLQDNFHVFEPSASSI